MKYYVSQRKNHRINKEQINWVCVSYLEACTISFKCYVSQMKKSQNQQRINFNHINYNVPKHLMKQQWTNIESQSYILVSKSWKISQEIEILHNILGKMLLYHRKTPFQGGVVGIQSSFSFRDAKCWQEVKQDFSI